MLKAVSMAFEKIKINQKIKVMENKRKSGTYKVKFEGVWTIGTFVSVDYEWYVELGNPWLDFMDEHQIEEIGERIH